MTVPRCMFALVCVACTVVVVFATACSSDATPAGSSGDGGGATAGDASGGNDSGGFTDTGSHDADGGDAHDMDAGGDADIDAAKDTGGDAGSDGGSDAGKCASTVPPVQGLVVTGSGPVQGKVAGGTYAFLGIPYAAPPVGALRYRPPAPHDCWTDTRDATAFSEVCIQLDATGDPTKIHGSEDCLFLNIWTPSDYTVSSKRPVMFFVHGGGHTIGSASEQAQDGSYTYDGQVIAEKGVAVVVTTNYRLGALGFVAHPALAAESPDKASGNYGTMDATFALGWVAANIAQFGGDPDRVMVFGESAGAVQTCMLVVSPLAAGLFHAAIMESGGCTAKSNADAETFGAQFVNAAGCGGASDIPACLRGLTAEAITVALPQPVQVAGKAGGYQPNIDGHVIPVKPIDALKAGGGNAAAGVVGANSDETSKSVPAQMTETQYTQAVYALVASKQVADLVLAQYPVADYGGDPRIAFIALTSDAKFICTARQTLNAAAQGGVAPLHRYFYTHAFENGGAQLKALGAFHGSELAMVFGHLSYSGYQPTAGEQALSDAFIGYWSRFAGVGDPNSPNGGGAPEWKAYDPAKDDYLQLDDVITAGEGIRTTQCDFWETLSP